jgi:GT2 family glycosyltransferase
MTDRYGVVLIGRNEGERLRRSLESVTKLTKRVVYADSASTDSSVTLAKSLGAVVVKLDDREPLNAARGRNAGFAALREHYPECDLVQFLDGDCRLVEAWPAAAIAFLDTHDKVAIVCGRRFETRPEASFYNRIADEEWNTPVGEAEACGGDAMVRVDAFEQIGGFNPSLMASEEPEMTARLRERGWKIWRIAEDMSEHDAATFSFGQWWRRTVRSGYGYAQAWKATRHMPCPVNDARLKSALAWVVAVPLAIIILAAALGSAMILLLLPAGYGLQVLRIALRRGQLTGHGLRASMMIMIAKVAELVGATRLFLERRPQHSIEYKAP